MISSSSDTQQSNEAYNTSGFELPNPAGKAGGACTSALLQVLYENGHNLDKLSWTDALTAMRTQLKEMGYEQLPQLSSSRWIDVNRPLTIVPKGSGRRRAIVVGINYVGQKGELKACHNDANNVLKYLIEAQGFDPSQILILMDDGKHTEPTRRNIEDAFVRMTQYSQPGDVVWVSFSGHGGRAVDISGDEDDGYDETLIPLDFMKHGQIIDDDILDMFVKPMKKGVNVTVLMDCCHSGTVLDLPYTYSSGDQKMRTEKNFDFGDGKNATNAKKQKEMEKAERKAAGENSDSDDEGDKKKKKKVKEKEEDPNEGLYDQSPIPPPQPRPPTRDLPPPPTPPNQCCRIL